MKKRPASEGRGGDVRRLRSAALCRASLRYGGAGRNFNGESGAKEPQKDIGKSAGEWHFYLEGKDNR